MPEAPPCATSPVEYLPVLLDGAQYFIPRYAAHRPACRAFLQGQYYEPDTHRLVRALLAARPGDMVHAGTFFGDMLPSFSRACAGHTVYAFEPVLENYLLARLCLEANRLPNVALYHAGLSTAPGMGYIQTHDPAARQVHLGGASRLADAGQPTALLAIDGLALSAASVIQLDVEGAELAALQGARQTLARCRPAVLIEDNERNCAPFLAGLGYTHLGQIPGLHIWVPQDELPAMVRLAEGALRGGG